MNVQLLKDKLIDPEHLSSIIFFEEIPSTNKFAKELPGADNVLILADHQTSGTGRFGREWVSASGSGLTFTLIKKFDIRIDNMHLVNFYSSYTMYLTLRELFSSASDKFSLKWPNDILLKGKKVCGILLDVQDLNQAEKKFIIGIGVNLTSGNFSEEIKNKAISLSEIPGNKISREEILLRFIQNFYAHKNYINDPSALMELWKSCTNVIGKKVNFKILVDGENISAEVQNIEPDGGLKVKLNDGSMKTFYSGEITFIY